MVYCLLPITGRSERGVSSRALCRTPMVETIENRGLKMLNHIAVVGGSLAGLRTVEALRREGFEGRITVIGAEDELPYDRPPLSKQFLVDDWEEEKLALARNGVEELKADWMVGCAAESLDVEAKRLKLADGTHVEADAIVLGTGARPLRLPFGEGLEGVLALRNLADARRLRGAIANAPRVVVVGAGFIGMEVAASCRQKGLDVSVVESLPAPLIRGLGSRLGERVAKRHREEGIVFHLGVTIDGFEGEGQVTGVTLSGGETLPAELVIVGIGATPATEWLEGAGLEIDDGVLCDATGSTGHEGIYALGDCARWLNARYPERPRFEHWTSAVEQSNVVAQRIMHSETEAFAPVPYVWTDQFNLRIAIAGEIQEGDEMHVCLGSIEEDRFLALFGREGRLAAAVGFKRPRQLNGMRRKMAEGEGISFADAVAEHAES
ncbi:MAG: FAD-dependent oxidoreductase [Deltaproteobacteria bacterium]|nr:FAD-dependent oxidoreductase [Deltaproteobacteria bacterium]